MRKVDRTPILAFVGAALYACGASSPTGVSSTHAAEGGASLAGRGGSSSTAGANAGGDFGDAGSAGDSGVSGQSGGGQQLGGQAGGSAASGGGGPGNATGGQSEVAGSSASGEAGSPSAGGVAGSAGAPSGWPQWQHDSQHSGRTEAVGPQSAGEPKWILTSEQLGLGGKPAPFEFWWFHSLILAPNGNLIVVTQINVLEITPEGVLVSVLSPSQESVAAAAADGTLYISDGWTAILSAVGANGQTAWQIPSPGGPASGIGVGSDGLLYLAWGGVVQAMTQTGNALWQNAFEPSEGGLVGYPAVAKDGTIRQCTGRGVKAIDGSGQAKWSYEDAPACLTPVVGDEGNAYFSDSTHVRAISPDGQLLWSVPCTNKSYPALGPSGRIYVDSDDTTGANLLYLRAYDSAGKLIWSAQHKPENWNGDTIPISGGDGTVYADASAWSAEGNLRYESSYQVKAMALANDGTLYAVNDWEIFAFPP